MSKVGRPSKLPKFLEAMNQVLSENENAKVLSKESLRKLANTKLALKDRVGKSTFEFWSTPNLNPKSPENQENLDAETVEEFRALLEDANVMGELNMINEALNPNNKNAYMYDKLLPRLYPQYRENNQIQIGAGEGGSIQITVGDNSHKSLVENILYGTPIIDIDHQEITEELKKLND